VNITYACPVCGTAQTATAATGAGVEVPECSNPACSVEPAWGAISLTMMKQAVSTNMAGHPTNTAGALARFILRLLNRARKVPATTDPDDVAVWTEILDQLASR
jgi:hypothetical protein